MYTGSGPGQPPYSGSVLPSPFSPQQSSNGSLGASIKIVPNYSQQSQPPPYNQQNALTSSSYTLSPQPTSQPQQYPQNLPSQQPQQSQCQQYQYQQPQQSQYNQYQQPQQSQEQQQKSQYEPPPYQLPLGVSPLRPFVDIKKEFDSYKNNKKGKFTTKNIESIFNGTFWDPNLFGCLKELYSKRKKKFIYNTYASWATECLLPEYRELALSSDEAEEKSNFYKHLRGEPLTGDRKKTYSIWQVDHEKKGFVEVKAPYPAIGLIKKYTKYDHIDFGEIQHRFRTTVVKTFDMDTLDVAKLLLDEEKEPSVCVLSMTHPKKPGGTWLQGMFGQEESLFVRTTLSCGTDKFFYPLDPYDSVFTKDVVVIRGNEKMGYPFLSEEERYMIDVISMSGYKLDEKPKYPDPDYVNTVRLKVRSMLIACIDNNVRNLVLGALGCGAFSNDPLVVAKIFKAELEVFAGFFNKVYFAVLDDDQKEFNTVLVGEKNKEKIYRPRINWFRKNVAPTLGSLVKCEKGRRCADISPEHLKSHDHTPLCIDLDKCEQQDAIHRMYFRHKEECPYEAFCPMFEDEEHTKYFVHTKYHLCSNEANCSDTSYDHLSKFLHYPICANGKKCTELGEHREKYRHLDECPCGTNCKMFGNKEHYAEKCHPFIRPCTYDVTGRTCANRGETHFREYSHLCVSGPSCTEKGKSEHCIYNIHGFNECQWGAECKDFSEPHLMEYWHPGQLVRRKMCTARCKNYSKENRLEYMHPAERFYRSDITLINVRDPTLPKDKKTIDYNDSLHPYFGANVKKWYNVLCDYFIRELKVGFNVFVNSARFNEIRKWFDSLLPTHMCSRDVLKSVLKLQSLNSLNKLRDLWTSWKSLRDIAFTDGIGKEVNKLSHKNAKDYTKRYLLNYQYERGEEKKKEIGKKINETRARMKDPNDVEQKRELDRLENVMGILNSTPGMSEDMNENLFELRNALVEKFGEEKVKEFEVALEDLVESVITLLDKLPGIGDKKDEAVGTNMCVFGIIGPNIHDYGNTDCVIILKEDVMHHTDYFETLCAATFYTNGRYRYTKESPHIKDIYFDRRGWMGEKTYEWEGFDVKPEARTDTKFIEAKDQGEEKNCAKETYYEEKYNRVHDNFWSYAVTLEFILRTKKALEMLKPPVHKSLEDVTLDDVKRVWKINNSHSAIEGHLPGSFSLDYIDHIIIKKDAYDDLMKKDSKKYDPKAAAAFQKLIEKNGEGFLTVTKSERCPELEECSECKKCSECEKYPKPKRCSECENRIKFNHDKVVEAEFEFFDRRASDVVRPQVQGYSFGFCSERGDFECFVPASEKPSPDAWAPKMIITFAAMEGGFKLILGNTGDCECKGEKRDFYEFEIDKDNMGLCCKLFKLEEVIAQDPMFNAFYPKDNWIYYLIEVDYVNSRITVKHLTQDCMVNQKECSFFCLDENQEKKDIRKLTFVSFKFAEKTRSFIRDFKIEYNYEISAQNSSSSNGYCN